MTRVNRPTGASPDWRRARHLDGLNWPSDDPDAERQVRYAFRGTQALCEQIAEEIRDAYRAGDWDAHPPLTISIDPSDDEKATSISLTWDLTGHSAAGDTYAAYELIRTYLSRYYRGWLEKLEPYSIEVGLQ